MEITEKDRDIIDKWFEDAKEQTIETLPKFMQHVLNDYEHDYGTICHAISACAIAASSAANATEQGGITGFQAGAVMWSFIRRWNYTGNKTGLKIIDYDDMLYPQYEEKFDKVIDGGMWELLKMEAKELLETKSYATDRVKAHWQSIVDGKVPFGYTVKN